MGTADTGQAAMVRPFADVLSEVNKGVVADEAATRLAELVASVRETGKGGSVTVTVKVDPFKGMWIRCQGSGRGIPD
jgi:hypothetical protein